MQRIFSIFATLTLLLASAAQAAIPVTLYKNAGCSCCEAYIAYLKTHGFEVKAEDRTDMEQIRKQWGSANAASCHTMRIGKYTVEGHVPVAAISKLLKTKPVIAGIAVPGMPMNSPGMGTEKAGTLTVYALNGKADGALPVFGKF
ncbi:MULTISPECIES: DUF411 domain-containing protein [Silvimonas]|uniref:DUF411 domain-containing protein n=1 Tax=Silvimonas TaxID=300264 RepID=UPI0024B3A5DA|nr:MULTISPECIES: DUF411 domain-containing protein [Silvimonas]MDR3428136.1 DUF411 domain-containing protein [Silvimonas sp.]